MKFTLKLSEIQNSQPQIFKILRELAFELETFFKNVNYSSQGLHIGDVIIRKDGLIRSATGLYIRKPIESDSPVCAVYRQDGGNQAGAGSFQWDSIVHEAPGYFLRAGGNTQIQIARPGKYLFVANVVVANLGAGARVNIGYKLNTVFDCRTVAYAGADGFAGLTLTSIIQCVPNDLVKIDSDAGDRYGGAFGKFTQLSVYKLN